MYLEWTKVSGANSYNIYSCDSCNECSKVKNTALLTYNIAPNEAGTYSYKVRRSSSKNISTSFSNIEVIIFEPYL